MIAILALTFFKPDGNSLGNAIFMGAITDYDQIACTAADTPPSCYDEGGLGYIFCNADTGKWDTTYCVNVQPVTDWLKTQPMQFVKNNIVLFAVAIGIIIIGVVVYGKKLRL